MTETQTSHIAELPSQKGFYRTPFGFYIADHKALANKAWGQTAEFIYIEGLMLIPNTYWSKVATLTEEELEQIENPDIREETRKAQKLMLEYPAQFVNLIAIGNKILVEPYGFGVKVLDVPLKQGHIEVYNHDVSKIKIGEPQEKYYNARLWIDDSAKEDDARFAVRGGDCLAYVRRFDVHLSYGPRYSCSDVAGLGFRPEGNQAYVNVNQALKELSGAKERITAVESLLK